MRLLLDTHALVWYAIGDPNLTPAAESAIRDRSNEVFISPASYWEIAIKVHLGKWKLKCSYQHLMALVLNTYGFAILPILPSHTGRLIGLADHHGDPFDRLLVAQALEESMTLVSADAELDSYGVVRHW